MSRNLKQKSKNWKRTVSLILCSRRYLNSRNHCATQCEEEFWWIKVALNLADWRNLEKSFAHCKVSLSQLWAPHVLPVLSVNTHLKNLQKSLQRLNTALNLLTVMRRLT